MHFFTKHTELLISKPFYKQIIPDTNGLRKAYVLYRFFKQAYFRNMHTHEF
ncbi:hypothetical protein HanIR_Chr04g0166871 [Helianthus annuus]|nr:hypothetical protein HanIR_Chr04g0166871 [Helianthus annuus]